MNRADRIEVLKSWIDEDSGYVLDDKVLNSLANFEYEHLKYIDDKDG